MKKSFNFYALSCSIGATLSLMTLQAEAIGTNMTPDQRTLRIIGGFAITANEAPYQVMLTYQGQQICGGTLIDAQWVLTAAHCLDLIDPLELRVRVGATLVSVPNEGYTVSILDYNVHPYWRGEPYIREGWDVALLKLNQPLPSFIPTAQLPSSRDAQITMQPGYLGLASGWGSTYTGYPGSNQLMAVELPIADKALCSYSLNYDLPASALCAGIASTVGTCHGDSGGPLVAYINGRYVSIGVVSWGNNDCTSYSVFSSTYYYEPWIKQVMGLY